MIEVLLFLLFTIVVSFVLVCAFGALIFYVLKKVRHTELPHKMPENQYAYDAGKLVNEIKATVKTCPMSAEQKSSLLRQVKDVPDNTAKALWKLYRLRKLKKMVKQSEYSENSAELLSDIKSMERNVIAELQRMRETLLPIPLALMKVDSARSERSLERIVAELSETNLRLNDLAAGYDEVRTASQSFRYP